jgi:hypothetical protein
MHTIKVTIFFPAHILRIWLLYCTYKEQVDECKIHKPFIVHTRNFIMILKLLDIITFYINTLKHDTKKNTTFSTQQNINAGLKLWSTDVIKSFELQLVGDPQLKPKALSESESELLYDWRFNAKQFVLATSPLRLTTSNFIYQLKTYSYSPYVTSYLTRGWVCRLQLLLVLASAVILRSESRGIHYHIFETTPNLDGQVPVFIPPRTGWPGYTPRHWVPVSSLLTTRRATMEVFDPASTRGNYSKQHIKIQFVPHRKHITCPLQRPAG